MSVKEQSIKVSIAGRVYPLTVNPVEEEFIRKAVLEINLMVKDYEKKYAVKDKQDLLAMCALEYSTEKLRLEEGEAYEEKAIAEQIKRMEEKINAVL